MKTFVPIPLFVGIILFFLLVGVAGAEDPTPTIQIAADGAPNAWCSPNWSKWVENAIYEVATDGPDSFENHDVVTPGYFIVTGDFPSWLGQADPGATFGPAYAGECGTRTHWVTRIKIEGGKVDIADGLSFRLEANALYPSQIAYTVTQYTPLTPQSMLLALGVDYGPDGQKGTTDDVLVTTGTGLVDEILLLTPGIAYVVRDQADSPQSQQAELGNLSAVIERRSGVEFRACASFGGSEETCHILKLAA